MFHLLIIVLCIAIFKAGHSYDMPLDQGSTLLNFKFKNNPLLQASEFKQDCTMNSRLIDATNTKKRDHLLKGGLPGQPSSQVNFKQYAGEISVDSTAGRALFYYFVESANDSSTDPLILWLNGGPGCSSLGMGALTEIGPFGVNPDGQTLYSREFAWNKVANLLFLESPAGVGFSYSNTTSDYNTTGDQRTAEDTYVFLMKWLDMYPTFKGRDFYLTGESYAGYYIPELADIILEDVKNSRDSNPMINLQGMMIGNGVIDDETFQRVAIDFLWSHALVSHETREDFSQNCFGGMFGTTLYAISAMGLKVIEPWQSWAIMNTSGQVAGFKVVYDRLTYATVLGAGHQVSLSYPDRLFHLLNDFLGKL